MKSPSMKWAPVWISLIIMSFSVGAAVPRVLNTTVFSTLFTGEAASGQDAFGVSTNLARWHIGTGAGDWFSSDGTTINFNGPITTSSALTSGTITLSGGTGTATVSSNARCVCSVDTAFLACQPSVSSTTLTVTVTAGGSNTVSYICM